MKPLAECPRCLSPMVEGKDDLSRYRRCTNYHNGKCELKVFERYIGDSQDVSYISYAFKTWDAYTHFDCGDTHFPSFTTYIYSIQEREDNEVASPLVTLKNFIPDFTNLESIDKKIKFYLTFL